MPTRSRPEASSSDSSAADRGRSSKDFLTDFDKGLSKTGYIHGKNIQIEYRWADGHYDRLLALVTELINRDAAVIVAGGPPAALAAKSVTSAVPIVFIASDAARSVSSRASIGPVAMSQAFLYLRLR